MLNRENPNRDERQKHKPLTCFARGSSPNIFAAYPQAKKKKRAAMKNKKKALTLPFFSLVKMETRPREKWKRDD